MDGTTAGQRAAGEPQGPRGAGHAPRPSRRSFLASSSAAAGGAWVALHAGAIASLAGCARQAAVRGEPFTTLTAGEAQVMHAFAARIVPSGDGLPGAEEAGAAHFVDRAVGGFFADLLPSVRELLRDLDAGARAADPAGSGFAALAPAEQDALIERLQDTPGFFVGRDLVVAGVFADPRYGGGRGGAGAAIVDVEHRPVYAPPFGYYDARGGGGA